MEVDFKARARVWDPSVIGLYKFWWDGKKIRVYDSVAKHYIDLPGSMSTGSKRRLLGLARRAKKEQGR